MSGGDAPLLAGREMTIGDRNHKVVVAGFYDDGDDVLFP
jgi:hypothetical protein